MQFYMLRMLSCQELKKFRQELLSENALLNQLYEEKNFSIYWWKTRQIFKISRFFVFTKMANS